MCLVIIKLGKPPSIKIGSKLPRISSRDISRNGEKMYYEANEILYQIKWEEKIGEKSSMSPARKLELMYYKFNIDDGYNSFLCMLWFALNDPASLQNIQKHWLPLIETGFKILYGVHGGNVCTGIFKLTTQERGIEESSIIKPFPALWCSSKYIFLYWL